MRRLLLVEPDGRATLCDPDSGVRTTLDAPERATGEAGTGRSVVRTAAWSAPGGWAACALDAVELDGTRELRLHHRADPGATEVLASELTAFYLCPSPCGRFLAHLSPGPLGLELGVSEVGSGELRVLERGQPLFWAWSADSSAVAVHVEDRLFVVPNDGGEPRVLTDQAGPFLAPWWTPDNSVVMLSADNRLLAYGLDGSVTELAGRCRSGRFALDATGRRVAVADLVDDGPALVVLDLLTGERDVVARERTGGFFWSPEGRRLAALVVADDDRVQWIVSDGEGVLRLPPFRPGQTWAREVLPFFEQYSQSHAVWSADGTQLVAVGVDDGGALEAVIQTVGPTAATERIPGARLAWWADGDQ